MNSSRRKLAAILEALGVPPSARRHVAAPAAPACEPLEGRQLMASGAGLIGMGMGLGMGVADVSGQGASIAPIGQDAGVPSLATSSAQVQLQTDQANLKAATQAVQDQSMVTPAMLHTVTADLNAIKAAETTTPNSADVTSLKAAIRAADVTVGGPTLGQVFSLEVAQNTVYLSQGVSASLIGQLDNDEMAVMMATGITPAEEAMIAADASSVKADYAAIPTTTPTTPVNPIAITTTLTPTSTPTSLAPASSTTSSTPTTTPPTTSPAVGWAGSRGPFGFPGAMVAPGSESPGITLMGEFGLSGTGGHGAGLPGGMAGATGSTTTAPTAAQTTLQLAAEKLRIDTQAVHDKSQVTPAMEAAVRMDLETIHGAATTPPNSADVATVQADLKLAKANAGGPTVAQLAQVQADQAAVYESEGVNAVLVAKLDADQAAVKTASGSTASDQAALVADQAAVKTAEVAVAPPTTTTSSTTTPTPAATPETPRMDPVLGLKMMGGGFGPGWSGPRA